MKRTAIGKDMGKKNLIFNNGLEIGDTINSKHESPKIKLEVKNEG